jgi:hypothetical protein
MLPLAKKLQEMNNNVIIGSGEEHLSLFRNELSGLSYILFSGFKPKYSRFLPQYLSLLFKLPLLLYHSIAEHLRLKKIIKDLNIDIIISDNRFGLWNKKITSVYVTHMPLIPFPRSLKSFEFIGVYLHRQIMERYSLCFIPDLPGELNLSGRLSHGIILSGNVRYIGLLSRFTVMEPSFDPNPVKYQHNTVILSGPEPQKGILKQKLIALFRDKEPQTIMFEGKPHDCGISRCGNITFYSHLSSGLMKEIISESNIVVTRSGYSTLMELVSMNRTAVIIPTPGQTEQEYLAEYLSEKGWFSTIPQKELDKGISSQPGKISDMDEFRRQSPLLLAQALDELLKNHHCKG